MLKFQKMNKHTWSDCPVLLSDYIFLHSEIQSEMHVIWLTAAHTENHNLSVISAVFRSVSWFVPSGLQIGKSKEKASGYDGHHLQAAVHSILAKRFENLMLRCL